MAQRLGIAALFISVYIFTVSCDVEEDNTPSYNIFSDDDPHEFTLYEERVKIIQKILAAECSDQHLQRLKRAIISGHGDTQLFVEKILYEKLVRKLAECRIRLAQRTSLMPTTITIPTTATLPTTTSRPQPPECQTAINLTESWRLDHSGSKIEPVNGGAICDTEDMKRYGRPWFRFTGAAGNRLLNRCPPDSSCGSHRGIWTDEPMPAEVGVVTTVDAFFSWSNKCKEYTQDIRVMRCSEEPHDLIYRWMGDMGCSNGFCEMRGN